MKKVRQITLLMLLLCLISSTINAQSWGKGIKGEGPIVTKELDIDAFTGIHLTTSADIYIKQGSTQKVTIEAQQNIIDLVKTSVKGKTWKIGYEKNVREAKSVKFYITLPTVTNLGVSGSGSVQTDGRFTGLDDLDVHISGSGDVKADVEAGDISTHISGSGDVSLAGSANSHDIHISGSGDVESYRLQTENCDVHISGSGECEIYVKSKLDVAISGSGDVSYKGDPGSVRSKVSGSGDVQSKG
ncbi:MAG: head GIN domain-containing protein [Bacteroidota bacterium]